MRIAIDALGIARLGGGRSATLSLLENLLRLDQQNEYWIFLDAFESSLETHQNNSRQIIAPTMKSIRARAWAQFTWPRLFKQENIKLVHHVKNLTIFNPPCPSIVTIHDLTILEHPEFFPYAHVLYWKTFEKYAVKNATRVIAISEQTANDLENFYRLPRNKMKLIHEGISDSFSPTSNSEVDRIRCKYDLPSDYLLHVGSISAKKNLATLAEAYFLLVREGKYSGALVLVGRYYWNKSDPDLQAVLERNKGVGSVILTGPVEQEDLSAIYQGATCFVFPSLHEGFGLVPFEAIACGTPVVATRVGTLEELAGSVIQFVDDARDTEELANAISRITSSIKLQRALSEQGLAIRSQFSSEKAARETLTLYDSLINRQ